MMDSIEKLKEKISHIESGCARELVMRLHSLKNEVITKIDGKANAIIYHQETVEQMVNDISAKVNHIVK